ncbi:AraC family transcriptional regulator [Methylovorus glucosotrophus]|nr:helix-turn-helix transcriptional regulator [Methylovorus glucosotrophus]
MPVTAMAEDYPDRHFIQPHTHRRAQFLYATQGVMIIETSTGRWVVPPSRGVWLQAHVEHTVRMRGDVCMRTLFVNPDAVPELPQGNAVVAVSPLLRELILAATSVPLEYETESRNGRLMRFLLDELQALPVLPFHIPWPTDARLAALCHHIYDTPDDQTQIAVWSGKLAMSVRTFHRRFRSSTGITFAQWRQLARLLRSLERLAEGASIIQVALEHGYTSQSAYAALFKRHFGVSPSMFYR